ncbi:MAG: helix-turn-helix domain-containing protein [Actinobacteria bacterium]|nr:helix-turn-helix domain-containing protein [Actinomycetota bacterium]
MRAKTAKIRSGPLGSASVGAGSVDTRPGTVATVVYDGLSLLEFAVACDVFGYADPRELGSPWYRHLVCGAEPSVRVDNGLTLSVPHGLDRLRSAHTVVLPPTDRVDDISSHTLAAIRRAHDRGARIVSLCTGAFVLAATGLLEGRRATTHWAECAAFSARYPTVTVDPGVLYVDDGDLLTSAGSAAALDLCLHLVRSDFGAEIANRLARQLVVPPHRDGGQAQYIENPMPELRQTDPFASTLQWLQANLGEQITIETLADRAAMSRRSFARHFAATTGVTPYQWLLRQRLLLARRLLETTDRSIDRVAEDSGFVNGSNLRKHFQRHLRTSPQAYRSAFTGRSSLAAATG